MTYTRHYLGTRQENDAQARRDCIEYLGGEKEFLQLCWNCKKELYKNFKHVRTAEKYRIIERSLGMFVGICGRYPVRAMAREILK